MDSSQILIAQAYIPTYDKGMLFRKEKKENFEMKDTNCAYCMMEENPSLVAAFGIPICDLSVSTLILFKEQSHPGRCIVAYKDHVSEVIHITPEQRTAFMEDIAKAANAIHKAFQPNKVNYGAYGDTGCHLHMHLVPKYKDEFEWGGVFEMNPGRKTLTDAEYAEMIEKIKAALD
ncbi:MAG: HIT family protein [Ileibacterium sp.]|nr:HIT family protein [Ileibacterium sp.]